MTTELAIQTIDLTKRYKQRLAVESLSLEVQRGEVFGFLGPNGAGKTTTIAMLLGLVRPTAGQALLFGHDVQHDPVAALRNVGAMIEAPAFYPYLSGRDNLRVLARADGVPPARIDAVLAAVELSSRARDRFGTYSQGMKQRLAIAAALLADPDLIMLDEPTNGLDPAGTVEVRELIRSLATEGRTIFLCSHLLHEVEQVCSRVAIIKAGRRIAQGSVRELLQRGQVVQVRVVGAVAPAVALLQQVEWVRGVQHDGDLLLVDAPAARAPEINALLTRNDILVAEIRTREESLEQFFLEVTEHTT
ncbi:MAG: ATP-binding cassette domain-containing protein [Chloroflexaceae bacterium]|nr:ATP-binding cassette domain-containing protein [Chloroflexaceae bacterium]NJO04224.1 ATP-binding cassette domain-containing protein [Chloroflexaceae bacterium]